MVVTSSAGVNDVVVTGGEVVVTGPAGVPRVCLRLWQHGGQCWVALGDIIEAVAGALV